MIGAEVVLVVALVGEHLRVELVLAALGRRHVAEVLVDPVRPEAGHDAAVPPRRGLHLAAPLLRGVPVVADVVVVEDHRARHGRQQPPVGRVGPRERVEVGVLLVVLQLGPRRLLDVAARLDEGPHLVGGLVGVDLVAEEEHQVGQPVGRQVGVVGVGRRRPGRRSAAPRRAARRRRGCRCPPRRGTPTCGTSRRPGCSGRPSSRVAITGAGNGEPASGQTCSPSIATV